MQPKFANKKDDKLKARYPYKTISSIVALKTFVHLRSVPFVGEMTLANEKCYRNTRLPVVTVFTNIDHEKNARGFKYLANRVRKVALHWKRKVVFNLANMAEFNRDMDQKYDMEDAYGSKPILVGLRDGSMYYNMEGDFSVKHLMEFVTEFKQGRLEGNEQVREFIGEILQLLFSINLQN